MNAEDRCGENEISAQRPEQADRTDKGCETKAHGEQQESQDAIGICAKFLVDPVHDVEDSPAPLGDVQIFRIDRLAGVLDLYRLETGSYPSEDEGLAVLFDRPVNAANWNGPYIRNRDSLTDPWGNPYGYRYPGEHGEFDLYSLGADGREGGEGENQDITSW